MCLPSMGRSRGDSIARICSWLTKYSKSTMLSRLKGYTTKYLGKTVQAEEGEGQTYAVDIRTAEANRGRLSEGKHRDPR